MVSLFVMDIEVAPFYPSISTSTCHSPCTHQNLSYHHVLLIDENLVELLVYPIYVLVYFSLQARGEISKYNNKKCLIYIQ